MAAGSKTFQTLFNIAAKFTGASAFAQANRAIDRTERNAKQASVSFGRMFASITGGIGASILAWKAWHATIDIAKESFAAATEVKGAYDQLRLSQERLVAAGRLQPAMVAKQTQEFVRLSEAMAKAGGVDAEALQVGMAGLSKYLTPTQINQMSEGWQDWMVRISKGAPTMEKAAELSNVINTYIQRGRPQALAALGLTKEQVKALGKLTSSQARAAAVAKIFSTATGETARWMQTSEGIAYREAQALEDLHETMGAPMVRAMDKINLAQAEFYKSLGPVAELIAAKLDPALDRFSKALVENGPAIAKFSGQFVEAISYMVEHADRMKMVVAPILYLIEVGGWVQEMWKKVGFSGEQAWTAIAAAWASAGTFFSGIWQNLQSGSSRAWTAITSLWNGLGAFFSGVVESVRAALAPVYEAITAPFKRAFDWVTKNDPAKGYIPRGTGGAQVGSGGRAPAKAGAGAPSGVDAEPEGPLPEWQQPVDLSEPNPLIPGQQLGGLISHPMLARLAERGIPEMVIPLRSTDRSRGLLSQAATALGMGGRGGGELTPVNLTMNAPITVNGAPVGQEGAIAREVQKALQDPIRNLLDQIKAARAFETRLGYV